MNKVIESPTFNRGYSHMEILRSIKNENPEIQKEIREIILSQWVTAVWEKFAVGFELTNSLTHMEHWENYLRRKLHDGNRFY